MGVRVWTYPNRLLHVYVVVQFYYYYYYYLKIYKPVFFLFSFVLDDSNGSETKENKYNYSNIKAPSKCGSLATEFCSTSSNVVEFHETVYKTRKYLLKHHKLGPVKAFATVETYRPELGQD